MAITSPDGISYPTNADPQKTLEQRFQDTATSVQTAITDVRSDTDILLAGKASTSHSHAASDITSGTLDILRVPAGSLLQVAYYTNNTYTTGNSSAWTDISSNLRLNFTPKRSSSKMIVVAAKNYLNESSRRQVTRMLRDGVVTGASDLSISNGIGSGWTSFNTIFQWEDTTAHSAGVQVTYSFQTAVTGGTWYYNYNYGGVNGTSMYTIWEIAT